jgi:hypothetical protein
MREDAGEHGRVQRLGVGQVAGAQRALAHERRED